MLQRWTRLPVFRLRQPQLDHPWIAAIADFLELRNTPVLELPDGTRRFRSGARHLDVSPDMSVWYEDRDHLWNTESHPARLPPASQVRQIGETVLERLERRAGRTTAWRLAVNSGSKMATASISTSGTLERTPCEAIDAYVGFAADLEIEDPVTHQKAIVPIAGRGGKAGLVFGDDGRLIGLNSSWRPVAEKIDDAPSLPPLPTGGIPQGAAVTVDAASARLVYRAVTLRDGVAALAPFWLYDTYFMADGGSRRSYDVASPAAQFDWTAIRFAQPPPRTPAATPVVGTSAYAIGLSWRTQGNDDADAEEKAVLERAQSLSWDVRFAWRDNDAWELDWNADANNWVNAADLAYYAGHAYFGGLQLTDYQNGQPLILSRDAVGAKDASGTLFGGSNGALKWIMVGACGPLQDDCAFGDGNDAFEWAGAFDGLRLMMGFASSIAGFTQEGARAMTLAANGDPLARSWLRAAREGQPSNDTSPSAPPQNRWAAAMGVDAAAGSSFEDCLPGQGILADLSNRHNLRVIWAPA